MAVAAAIGAGDDLGSGEGRPSPRPSSNRIIGQKQSVVVVVASSAARTSHLGEINRSIEKMSLSGGSSSNGGGGGGKGGGGCQTATAATTSLPKAVIAGGNRRDSNWTSVSTEGYGSMRSSEGGGGLGGGGGGGGGGRRCSELSAMSQASNLSTRANVNSPWDPISVGSSRRSSVAEAGGGAPAAAASNCGSAGAISHHIDRLRRRSRQKAAAASQTAPPSQAAAAADGRQSAMSDCTVESQQQPSFAAPRRASDPVRTLDRNFGVGGQLASQARHGSYNQLNKQRLPLSGVMADGARNQVRSCHSLHIHSSSFISIK